MSDLLTMAEADQAYPTPSDRTPEENEGICKALEALFNVSKERRPDFPSELSHLLKAVNGERRTILALNAGDGSLIDAFDAAESFGIEADEKKARHRKGGYHHVLGDLKRLRTLFEPFDSLLADVAIDVTDNTDLADALDFIEKTTDRDDAFLYLIAHSDEKAAECRNVQGVYAEVHLPAEQLWVLFGMNPAGSKKHYHEHNPGYPAEDDAPALMSRNATADTLDLLGPWVLELYGYAKHRYYSNYRQRNNYDTKRLGDIFTAIRREFGRRFRREEQAYDVELVGGRLIHFNPSDWTKRVLDQMGRSDLVSRLNKRDINFFAQNAGFWDELTVLADKGILLIDPIVVEKVTPIVDLAKQSTTPLRELKPQERIGFLRDVSEIKCLRDDEEKGFEAGRWYRVSIREIEYFKPFEKSENVKGELKVVKKRRRYLHQAITINGRHTFYDDDPEHIGYLLKFFDVPDPGDIATRYPEAVQATREIVAKVQQDYLTPRGYTMKPYQAEDLARVLTKDRAILAWEQGLGKSLGGLTFSVAAAVSFAERKKRASGLDLPTLIVAPQDLIPQWIAEAKKFYGIELTWIGQHKGGKSRDVNAGANSATVTGGAVKNLIEAKKIADHLRVNPYGGGFYITHFEALTSGGARNLKKLEEPFIVRREKKSRYTKAGYRTVDGVRRWFDSEIQEYEVEISSAQECPECGGEMLGRESCPNVINTRGKGVLWDGKKAIPTGYRKCGYTRLVYKMPSIGQVLSTAFRKGVIVVDEGTQIASSKNSNENTSSQKTKAVCGLRASHRLVMSGTPVKNFIAQAFWLLWWGVGGTVKTVENGQVTRRLSPRFPYSYSGGRGDFAKDFTVREWTYNDETGNWANVKEVGEVTNHSRLWAQLAAVLLRRVKEQTGELIPAKKIHVINTPLGYYQREQMDFWLQHFPELYAELHPDDPKVKRGTHVGMAAMLGMDVKLNYAAVMPRADKHWEWTGVNVSNYTPAALKTLTTTMALVKQGRQVLVGTDLKAATGWIAEKLELKGVNVRTMLKSDGSGDTLDPADRAAVVKEFQEGKIQVLVSTQKAIRLGHNLDKGSAVVFHGLDWDYETYAQFRDRVHRLTSERPVDVYVILPGPSNLTLVGRKWDVIQDKSKGAAMAIDGRLPETAEVPVDIGAIVRELQESGIERTGEEVMESDVKKAWDAVPNIASFEIPHGFDQEQAKPWMIDWEAANEALNEWVETRRVWDEAHEEALLAIFLRGVVQYDEPIGPEWVEPETVEEDPVVRIEETLDYRESIGVAPSPDSTPIEIEEPVEMQEELERAVQTVVVQQPILDSAEIKQRLIDAKELLDLGILTQDEFNETKGELLALLRGGSPKPEAVVGEQLTLAA